MHIRSRGGAVRALTTIAIVAFVVPASASIGATGKKSYVVVMRAPPAVAYDGGIAGLPATKPAKGQKINPNSAAVKKYQAHLESQHNASLRRVGASMSAKIHDYTIALNGYSAILSVDQAAALRLQKNVATVQEDELHQPTTDASPQLVGLTNGRAI
jgi:peptidase inhibitor I9